MAIAEIITIGTELLLGEIQDTNTRYIARNLRDYGFDIYRTTTVGDNPQRVAQAVRDAAGRAQIIITTGGLGPTVDDPTREAIALAMNVQLEFHPELWDQIIYRFNRFEREPTENNKRQAYLPAGSIAIENPVGTAPAFIAELGSSTIICLPGVPREMEFLMNSAVIPYLHQKFPSHGVIKTRVLHTIGTGESQVDELIGDLERSKNPTVGLLANPGQVDVRITAKAETEEQANDLIGRMEIITRKRLDNMIYACDDETLEEIIKQKLEKHTIFLNIIECGLNGTIAQKLKSVNAPIKEAVQLPDNCNILDLNINLHRLNKLHSNNFGMGVSLNKYSTHNRITLIILLILGEIMKEEKFFFGGHHTMAINWATTIALDFLRKNLSDLSKT